MLSSLIGSSIGAIVDTNCHLKLTSVINETCSSKNDLLVCMFNGKSVIKTYLKRWYIKTYWIDSLTPFFLWWSVYQHDLDMIEKIMLAENSCKRRCSDMQSDTCQVFQIKRGLLMQLLQSSMTTRHLIDIFSSIFSYRHVFRANAVKFYLSGDKSCLELDGLETDGYEAKKLGNA